MDLTTTMLPMPITSFGSALARVHDRIDVACAAAGRQAQEVQLLLATKTQSATDIRTALLADTEVRAGRRPATMVGENRAQELVAKAPELADLALTAHFIGPLQSNKINQVLRALALHGNACVETVDSVELAERLGSRLATAGLLAPLDVLIQVNVSAELTKAGVAPDEAGDLATAVAQVPGLRLAGFMTIAERSPDESRVRASFARLRQVRDAVTGSGLPGTASATTLSMGMSGDLEWAIAEGATVVRVGSAVFGAR